MSSNQTKGIVPRVSVPMILTTSCLLYIYKEKKILVELWWVVEEAYPDPAIIYLEFDYLLCAYKI